MKQFRVGLCWRDLYPIDVIYILLYLLTLIGIRSKISLTEICGSSLL